MGCGGGPSAGMASEIRISGSGSFLLSYEPMVDSSLVDLCVIERGRKHRGSRVVSQHLMSNAGMYTTCIPSPSPIPLNHETLPRERQQSLLDLIANTCHD